MPLKWAVSLLNHSIPVSPPQANVLMELRKWKLAFMEQHKLEVRKEREKHAACIAGLTAEMDSLKELLHTYETSNQRKDEVRSLHISYHTHLRTPHPLLVGSYLCKDKSYSSLQQCWCVMMN